VPAKAGEAVAKITAAASVASDRDRASLVTDHGNPSGFLIITSGNVSGNACPLPGDESGSRVVVVLDDVPVMPSCP
jgi:hypothetical protein